MASKQTQNVHAIGCKKTKPSDTFKCGCCGKQHRPKECPAYGKMCDLCHKPNHFTKVCRTRQHQKQTQTGHHKPKNKKKVDAIEESESETSDEGSTSLFIDPLRIEGITKQSAWLSTVTTECGNVTFKLDTGAEYPVFGTVYIKWSL